MEHAKMYAFDPIVFLGSDKDSVIHFFKKYILSRFIPDDFLIIIIFMYDLYI